MAVCSGCGAQIDDRATVCPRCGLEQRPVINVNDTGNRSWGYLGFFIPFAGLILWLVSRKTHPRNARMALLGWLFQLLVIALAVLLLAWLSSLSAEREYFLL